MKIIEPSNEVIFHVPERFDSPEQFIEWTGRKCYKSEDGMTEGSADKFVKMLKNRGHHAMLEHCVASAYIIADRGLTHELVRHRLASFAQESTRYCNYGKGKFGSELTVIQQPGLDKVAQETWEEAMKNAETSYMELLDLQVKPEIARSVLPIGLKTEIVITANLREWMHIFELRCSRKAHPIIRGVMLNIQRKFSERISSMFMSLD